MKGIKYLGQAVVATAALTLGGVASAAPIAQNGLFFSGYDPVNNTSILVNLNKTATQFFADPTAGFSLGSTAATALGNYLSTANLAGFRWNVIAVLNDGSNDGTTASPFYGGLATSKNIETTLPSWGIFGGLESYVGDVQTFISLSNPNLASSDVWVTSGQGALQSPAESTIGFSQFPGDLGAVGETLSFYRFFADQSDPLFNGSFVKYSSFTLNLAGNVASLVYNGTTGGTEVPLPAAVWLFGSALLGFAGIGRRRREPAAA
jgi:hypothetical protein